MGSLDDKLALARNALANAARSTSFRARSVHVGVARQAVADLRREVDAVEILSAAASAEIDRLAGLEEPSK